MSGGLNEKPLARWKDLSHDERATIRKLAVGYTHDVREGVLRRLAKLGLVEQGPERVTLTKQALTCTEQTRLCDQAGGGKLECAVKAPART